MNKKELYSDLPIIKEADVIVAGGGLAGCAAAIASARLGVKTLIIETGGCLGGAATSGLVAPISSIYTKTSGKKFGGILWEVIDSVIEKAKKYCNSTHSPQSALHLYKYVLIEKMVESGADILFHAFVTDVVSNEDGSIKELVISTKDGLKKILGKVFIDTTGDGDVMSKSAADTIIGSEPKVLATISKNGGLNSENNVTNIAPDDYVGQLQPVSLMMQFGNVDVKKAQQYMNKKITYEQLGITKEEFAKWKYANSLGFEITEGENAVNVYLVKDGTLFMLYERKNFEKMTSRKYEYLKGFNGHFEIALYVDTFEEVDSEYAKAIEKGARSVLEPTTEPWGQRTCYIADPEGNLIEIGSFNRPFESKTNYNGVQ